MKEAIGSGRACWRYSSDIMILELSGQSESGLMSSGLVMLYCSVNPGEGFKCLFALCKDHRVSPFINLAVLLFISLFVSNAFDIYHSYKQDLRSRGTGLLWHTYGMLCSALTNKLIIRLGLEWNFSLGETISLSELSLPYSA